MSEIYSQHKKSSSMRPKQLEVFLTNLLSYHLIFSQKQSSIIIKVVPRESRRTTQEQPTLTNLLKKMLVGKEKKPWMKISLSCEQILPVQCSGESCKGIDINSQNLRKQVLSMKSGYSRVVMVDSKSLKQ